MPPSLTVPPQLDDVARMLADPSRLRILWALGDGRAYTATELAGVAQLSPSAASNHLTRLVGAGFLEVRSQGRHRYFTLTREDIGRAVEAMAAVTIGTPVDSPKLPRPRPALRHARRCYGHLAGECGVALWDRLVSSGVLRQGGEGWEADAAGAGLFRSLGIHDHADTKPAPVRPCLDWTERRWHLGGALGRSVLSALQTQGVMAPSPAGDRVLLVNPQRWQAVLRSIADNDAVRPAQAAPATPSKPERSPIAPR